MACRRAKAYYRRKEYQAAAADVDALLQLAPGDTAVVQLKLTIAAERRAKHEAAIKLRANRAEVFEEQGPLVADGKNSHEVGSAPHFSRPGVRVGGQWVYHTKPSQCGAANGVAHPQATTAGDGAPHTQADSPMVPNCDPSP